MDIFSHFGSSFSEDQFSIPLEEDEPVAPTLPPACRQLVAEVKSMDSLEDLQKRHVMLVLRTNLSRLLEDTSRYVKKPVDCPFYGDVPLLDLTGRDIRVRINGHRRLKQLTSGPSQPGDRRLTDAEFQTLVDYIDYLIMLGNAWSYEEIPFVCGAMRQWIQDLPAGESAQSPVFSWP